LGLKLAHASQSSDSIGGFQYQQQGKNMKKQFTLSAILLALAGTASAQSSVDLPRLYPDCISKNILVPPAGMESTANFWNSTCTVAYVVPPPTASIEVADPAPSMNLQLCPAIEVANNNIVNLAKQVAQLDQAAAELAVDDPRRQTYNEMAEKLQARISTSQKTGSTLHGLTVQMNLKGSLTTEYMNGLVVSNLPSIEKGLKIRPAPLEKSYLSFNAIIPGTTLSYEGNPVLESTVEGILSKADESRTDRTSIRFNGGASGGLALNLNAACPIMEGDFKRPQALVLNKKKAGTYMVATQTMMVPLLTSFGYTASLDIDNLTNVLFTKLGEKSQFNHTDFTNLVISGNIDQAFKFTSWTYEDLNGNMQTMYEKDISADQRLVVKASMLDQYMNALIEAKFIKEIPSLETPNAGTSTETGIRRQCWSKSFLGMTYDSGCNNVSYQFQVARNGTLDQRAEIANHVRALIQETVEIWRPTSRVFTSSFKVK